MDIEIVSSFIDEYGGEIGIYIHFHESIVRISQ